MTGHEGPLPQLVAKNDQLVLPGTVAAVAFLPGLKTLFATL
jgi:hypothetical protein